MNNIPPFDFAQAASLKSFLDAPERSPESMSYGEAAGFLFVVACAPELVQPSEWVPIVIDPDNAVDTSLENMQTIMGGLMSLYNEMTRQVQEIDVALPSGCSFRDDPMANLESDASISQWASGFRTGYLWLEEMWSEYTPEEIKEAFGYQLTVLCFFSSRDMASDLFEGINNKEVTFESMAENMSRIFPDAMREFALLGNSIQQALSTRGEAAQQSARQPIIRGEKIGRNEPCTCGSGKKYKKCCGRTLH